MLDAYIIDAIREEELRREREFDEARRIWLEIPEYNPLREVDRIPAEVPGPIVIPLMPEIPLQDVEDDAA